MEWLRGVFFLFWLCRWDDSLDRFSLHPSTGTLCDPSHDSAGERHTLFVGVRESRSQSINLVVCHDGGTTFTPSVNSVRSRE